MKGQSSIEYLTVVGLGLVIASPFVVLIQQGMIDLTLEADDGEFARSLDRMEEKAGKVHSLGEPAEESFRLDVPRHIQDVHTGEDFIMYTQNRSNQVTNHSAIFEFEIQTEDLPEERGSYLMKASAQNDHVKIENMGN